ncbi:MAG TPA: hypothetical protein EYG49_06570 [Gammaproteobacteria bacterium]|jgi:hypothetical protein|nr:hypothetical protein [Gammaproteobacteria bacterium]
MKYYFIFLFFLSLSGCSETSSEYFPLGENIKLEYRIQKIQRNQQRVGKSIVALLSDIQVNGEQYFPQRYANGETIYYRKSDSGILFSARPEPNGKVYIKTPLAVNAYWPKETRIELLDIRHESFSGGEPFISQEETIFMDNQIVSFNETISVPAGRFVNCMRIDSSATVRVKKRTRGIAQIMIYESTWYAQGVGLVKRVRKEYSVPKKYRTDQVTKLIRYESF